ncbi:MAG: hypothetical protein AAFN09_04305 [Pseudomonadota bacterium]
MAQDDGQGGQDPQTEATDSEDSGTDLEKIITLQSRITGALDRIAAAAAMQAVASKSEPDPVVPDPEAPDPEEIAALQSELTELRAERDGLQAALSEAQAEVTAAATAPATGPDAATGPATGPEGGDAQAELDILRARAARFRDERNGLRDERDELADRLDAAMAASGSAPAPDPNDLITSLRQLRLANAELLEQCAELRQAAVQGPDAADPELLNATLVAELNALRAERAADATELADILSDLTPMASGG